MTEVFTEPDDPTTISFPGAVRPERRRRVEAHGVGIAVYEWGDPDAAPIFLCHGGLDFAGTFHLLAPLLAEAGWRVVAWDQRGHGDSDYGALYSFPSDVRDALAVINSTTLAPSPVVGHSKGGGLMMQLTEAMPSRVSHVVNLDGLPSRRSHPDIPNHERTKLLATDLVGWLDHRRRASDASRKPGTLDELARRRAKLNPRLPIEWLRYIVTVGARRDDDGWRWKLDPSMRFGGFGPWRPEWQLLSMPGIGVPFLGVLGLEPEEMGWGSKPDDIVPYLPPGARFLALEDTGHFVHIERPRVVAEAIVDLVGEPMRPTSYATLTSVARPRSTPTRVPTRTVRHVRVELALHRLRDGVGAPLLLLHGLGEATPETVPTHVDSWTGPIWGLDFTGHGASTVPVGGGYTCEVLMGDADAALHELGPCTVLGRGLGAYIALLIAGSRPDQVRGAILADGPGMVGGGAVPTSNVIVSPGADVVVPPDPFAQLELARDVRPPDYAATFARMVVTASTLPVPLVVAASQRPAWLEAVVDEPGVQEGTIAEGLALFAST